MLYTVLCVLLTYTDTDIPLLLPPPSSSRYSKEKIFPDVTNGFDRGNCCSFWTGSQPSLPAPSVADKYCKYTEETTSCIVTTWDSNTCTQCCTNDCTGTSGYYYRFTSAGQKTPYACTTTKTERGGTADCSRCPPCKGYNVLDEICVRPMV